jgi:cobalt transporter subunit CbtA
VTQFRKLTYVVLASGVLAGLLLFVVQHFTTFPLIQKAEGFESAAETLHAHHHDDQGWQPAEGFERTGFTVLTTIVTSIAFSALLFGFAVVRREQLGWQRGLIWGLAAYICIDLLPALGLPPQPPGTVVADLYSRQAWWTLTVVCAVIGLWLLSNQRRSMPTRLIGILPLLLPYAIGAPKAEGENVVPAVLIQQFSAVSLLTTALFWLVLGSIGGALYARNNVVENAD